MQMDTRSTPRISSRKEPSQTRSASLVAAILEAAVRVLTKEGAARFTTARVAERAGISVGSLYQYFPNKAAILFRLQSDEWRRTGELLQTILTETRVPPPERLRRLVHAFVRSECEEAVVRIALGDCAPLYRNTPEATSARESSDAVIDAFMREALPGLDAPRRDVAGGLIISTMTAVSKTFSESPRSDDEIYQFAEVMADMFCAYIDSQTSGPVRGPAATGPQAP